ncbi:hypothetical protein [Aureimonas sp. Leaf454]|uniref:hypothetical protein n=1 Tax=Aureimonas sp. Leaf454 TaxID=1736381 RepID=UPI0012E3F483|nr:hypothetical protein [Aureimonas sp. Leaf454]
MKAGEGYVIFCEDIRAEAAGRSTIVGVFSEDIIFSSDFPNTMPKLGVQSNVYVDALALPNNMTLRVEASWQEEPVAELEIDLSDEIKEHMLDDYPSRYPRDPLSTFDSVPRILSIVTVFPLFEVPQQGMLRVVCNYDGSEYLLGRKLIRAAAASRSEEQSDESESILIE